jgi:hypothetical protein
MILAPLRLCDRCLVGSAQPGKNILGKALRQWPEAISITIKEVFVI